MSASKSRLCWDENGCLVPRGVVCIKAINLCFPLRCLREETGSSLLWVFPRIACGCYPPRALRGSWPKPRRSPLLAPVVSISSTGETEGTIAEKLLFASFPSPMILIFPCGKTEGSDIRNEEEKLFFCKKFFSLQPPTGRLQIHFSKMRPTDRVFRPLRRATRAPRPGPRQAEPGCNPRL